MKRPTTTVEPAEAEAALTRRAYQAAGHLLLDYLLRRGLAAKYLPMDRVHRLPDRRHVTLNGEGTNWGERTAAAGSLLTVPQVLLAGLVAEQRKFNPSDKTLPAASPLADKARYLVAAYVDHYHPQEKPTAREQRAEWLLGDLYAYAGWHVRKNWRAVEAIAGALLQRRTLDNRAANELVRQSLRLRTLWGRLRLGLERLGKRRQ